FFSLIVLLGWTNLAWRTEILSPNDLRAQIKTPPQFVTLHGRLRRTPAHRVFESDDQESWRTLAQVEVSALRRGETWVPAIRRVMTSTEGTLDENFCAYQEIEVTGVLQTPRAPVADGLFDYRTYLRRQEIYFQLKVESTNDWQIVGAKQNPPLADRFSGWAKKVLAKGLPEEDEPLRLIWAMTLGWKTALTGEVSEPFMRSGTMHIFAISGLHIALITGILVAILRVLRIPRGFCAFIIVPLIWFYTMATGWQPSAIRSTIMMTIIVVGWGLKRPADLLNSLAASAFIILLWDPQQLFQASFQLSFFVVLSIALLMPAFEKVRDFILRPDPLLPAELRPFWRKILDYPLRYLLVCITTSLAAWLGSMPLIAYYFHLFTPVSLPANLLIVPLSSVALAANLGSLICGNWFPFATELFNFAAWILMKGMVSLSHWFSAQKSGVFYVPAPSLFACSIYYALLFTILNGWFLTKGKRIIVFAVIGVAVVFGSWTIWKENHSVQITVLPLSGGDSIFVDFPGRKNDLLIDCGNKNTAEFTLKPFLRAQGVNRLHQLVLTHGDLRHVGGTDLIRSNFFVEKIVTSSVSHRSPEYRRILSELKRETNVWMQIKAGDSFGDWKVLHSRSGDNFPTADDKPLVLRGTIFGKTILFLSDLSRVGQNVLLERNEDLRSDIVVTGLPAQSEPLTDAFLEKVQPGIIIVTDAEFPANERASLKLRERLARQKATVIYCRESGAVTLEFREGEFHIRTANEN
ncbi:MAG: ComEC/Rec2 family competence protein, partial [Verrucomicrobiota bacterium]